MLSHMIRTLKWRLRGHGWPTFLNKGPARPRYTRAEMRTIDLYEAYLETHPGKMFDDAIKPVRAWDDVRLPHARKRALISAGIAAVDGLNPDVRALTAEELAVMAGLNRLQR